MSARNMCRHFAWYALATIAALLASAAAYSADVGPAARIEVATGVVSVVRPDGGSSLVGVGHALQPGQAVRTERDSTARLRFSDGTDVVLRPSSQIRIDDFQFDRARPQSDNFALRLLKGGLRTITGAIAQRNRERVSYSTTTATIGVRGTDFVMRLCEDDCAREERVAGGTRLPDAAVARLGALSGGVSALRPDGRWRALDAGDAIYADDAIVTGASGVAVLFFIDDTRITLQPRSILVIDDYFYDAAAPRGSRAVLALLDGAARTQTGAIAKASPERFVFLTPERRIRVHGTLFDTVVQVVTGVVETAGEQAGQAAQQTQDAAKQAADKAADTATAPAPTGSGAPVADARQDGQFSPEARSAAGRAAEAVGRFAGDVVAAVGDAAKKGAEDAAQKSPPVETTPTPSGTGQKIPVPTADVNVGQAVGQVGGSVVGAVRDAGSGIAETWREVAGATTSATGEARTTTTRTTRRVVTWTGGKISGAVDAGAAAGESTVAAGGRTVDYVYDATGRVVAVGRGVVETGTATARDAIGAAAAATDRALAVVIPAIIGVARDAAGRTDLDERTGGAIATARETVDRGIAVGVDAVTGAARAVRDAAAGEGKTPGEGVTAVQVHDGAVTVADPTGEMAVRRGSLALLTDAGPMKARFDGVVASTAPSPAGFAVDGRLFGAAAGDTPAAGLYTVVRSGRIAMTRDGREVVLGPGEAGYADDSGGEPIRLREIPRFLEGDGYLAVAFDPSALMCGPATTGMPGVRTSAVRSATVSTTISAAAGLPGAGTWGLPGSRAAPADSGAYREAVGAAHFAATSGMSTATRAAYWGAFDTADLASRVDVSGRSGGAGMTADGVGVRGVGPSSGSFGEPAGGFAGGRDPGRGAATSFRDGGKWISGGRYGGTFAAGRRGLTRSGDIAIGAGDGTGDYRGGGGGNAAISWSPPPRVGFPDVSKTPASDGSPTAIPFPTRGRESPEKAAPKLKLGDKEGPTQGGEAGVNKGVVDRGTGDKASSQITGTSPVLVDGSTTGPTKNAPTTRERDDVLGGGDVIVVLNRADAGQLAGAIRRWIGAITGAAGSAGDGRTDQQDTTGGGPMIVDRGAQADAKRGSTSGGAVSYEVMFRINQFVNPGAQ